MRPWLYAQQHQSPDWSFVRESHEVWGVFDRGTKIGSFEGGIGFGVTPASDKITLKLMFSRDLN